MSQKVSRTADRVFLFLYVMAHGFPEPRSGQDLRTVQLEIFRKISGLSEQETISAFAELEDADFIEQEK